MSEIELLKRALDRERLARKEAEHLLECKSRDLYFINRELSRTAEELSEEVLKSQTIMDSATEGMIVFSETGKIESMNPAAVAIFGVTPTEAIGLHICHFVPSIESCDQANCGTTANPFFIANQNRLLEYPGVHSDGFAIALEIGFSEVNHGDKKFFLAMIRDLSGRKQLEAQLAQSQKLEAVGQLAAGIAHEINTPIQYVGDNTRFLKSSFLEIDHLIDLVQSSIELNNSPDFASAFEKIKNHVDLMDLAFLREEIPLAIDQALEGADSVTKIVRAMKDFSHPGGNEKQLIDLNRTIESTLTVSKNEWKYICELHTELANDIPNIPCYASELNQALLNLLINAAHAIDSQSQSTGRRSGVLTVKTYRDDPWAVIEIGDNGCGIPSRIQGRIFDPFFTTKPVGKGTGQGLAIAYNVIVKKHLGSIQLDSQEGVGTTFYLRLPLVAVSEPIPLEQAKMAYS